MQLNTIAVSLACLVGAGPAMVAAARESAPGETTVTFGIGGLRDVPWYMIQRAPTCWLRTARCQVRIDGVLDEPVWRDVPPLDQPHCDNGDGPLPYATHARFAKDDTHLYFAIECAYPGLDPTNVSKGQRDTISWGGETVELFVDTHRGDEAYVQVIFDMGGAFTDIFRGDEAWNGRIEAATTVSDSGWQLEARLMIADLGGPGGQIDADVWGANVCRSVEDMSGSWARLFGSYQQPDAFGLLLMNDAPLDVDTGAGLCGRLAPVTMVPDALLVHAGEPAALHLVGHRISAPRDVFESLLTIREAQTGREVWRLPLVESHGPDSTVVMRTLLPATALADGDYVARWELSKLDGPARSVSTLLVCRTDVRADIESLRGLWGEELMAALGCPVPDDPHDRAIVQLKVDQLLAYRDRESQGNRRFDYAVDRTYRKLREIVHAVRSRGRYAGDVRGWFESAIISPVDGSAQPFSLFVPPEYDPTASKTYPLLVKLHPGGGIHGEERGHPDHLVTDAFVMHPLGRGRGCGFAGVPGQDVRQQIQSLLLSYRIDPDRVHVQGESLGGGGTFQMASRWPDLFASASPICGGGGGLPVEQLVNVPAFIHHGLEDNRVPPSWSILPAALMMRERCPVQLYLHAGTGHGVVQMARTVTTWADRRELRRDSDPRCVVLSGPLPAAQKAYWLEVGSVLDPHQDSYTRATFVARNQLAIEADNVEWLILAPDTRWIDRAAPLAVTTRDGHRQAKLVVGGAPAVYIGLGEPNLMVTTTRPALLDDPTRYIGGGPMRLFHEGRPLRIVYGTTGSAEQTARLKDLAWQLRRWNGFSWASFECGGYPVLPDSDVGASTLARCDLIVLGAPTENSLAAKMLPQLPISCEADRLTFAGDWGPSLPIDDVAWSLYTRNPSARDRRLWWFAGVYDREQLHAISEVAERAQMDAVPDLVVADRSTGRILATGVYDRQWRMTRPGANLPVAPTRWASAAVLQRAAAERLKDVMRVDVSLVEPSELLAAPDRLSWDRLTMDEALNLIVPRVLVVVRVPGKALQVWRQRVEKWGRDPDAAWAGLAVDATEEAKTYRVLADLPASGALTGVWNADAIERTLSKRESRAVFHQVISSLK